MASFDIAYNKFIKPIEGGYSNVATDKGGETYGGISRKFWPNWSGWAFIDNVKAKTGTIARNKKFPELDAPVAAFYKAMWDKNYFGPIQNQDVANILFDWYVNSGGAAFNTRPTETYGIQEILNKWFGKKLATDGAMGPNTVTAINSVDAAKLYTIIKEQRKIFYDWIVKNDASQQGFYDGWLNRLKKFPDLVVPGLGVVALIITIGAVYYLFSLQDKPGQQRISVSSNK